MRFKFEKNINLGNKFIINVNKSAVEYSLGVPKTGISCIKNIKQKNDYEIIRQIRKSKKLDAIANVCLMSIFLIPLGIMLKLFIYFKYNIELLYEMDNDSRRKYSYLNDFLAEISKNNKLWQVDFLTCVYNAKFSTYEGKNIVRHKVNITCEMPWYISCNIDVFCLNLKNEKIYFMPDKMIIFKKCGGIKIKSYNNMKLDFSLINFSESEPVPRDAEIVRPAWEYISGNIKFDFMEQVPVWIPICKYGMINFKFSDGRNIFLECSNNKLIPKIQNYFMQFRDHHRTISSCDSSNSKCEDNDSTALLFERVQLINIFNKILERSKNKNQFVPFKLQKLEINDNLEPPKQLKPTELNDQKLKTTEDKPTALFTSVCVQGNEEKTQSIPPMNVKSVEKEENVFEKKECIDLKNNFEITFNHELSYHSFDFIEDIKRFENKECKEAKFVPFMRYYPTYDSMNDQQKDWYFYWRSQVRRGIYLSTDLSYIFIHIYELLSGYGMNSAHNGYKQLIELWENYRKEYPKLDRYLFAWMFDFARLNNLDFEMPDWPDVLLPYQSEIKNVIISKHANEIPLKLTFAVIDYMCNYSLSRSKFYNDGHQTLMNEAIPRVIALVDAALFKREGKGILDTYGPNFPKKQTHYTFKDSNCINANQRADIVVKDYVNSAELRSYIKDVVKYSENVLRKLYGCRSCLKSVSLNDKIAKLVKTFLYKEYSPNKREPVIEDKSEIQLNFENIKELRLQSDAVRNSLEVEGTSSESKELLTDLKHIQEVFITMPRYCRNLIDELQKNSWEIGYNPCYQLSIDTVNESFYGLLACNLLIVEGNRLILEYNYRSEFDCMYEHIANTEISTTEIVTEKNSMFDLTLLSEEMKQFFEILLPYQEEIILAILHQTDVKDCIDKIADAEMSMPEILVDEINDIASQYIGDILIDTFKDEMCILEQYEKELKKAIK